MDRYLFPISIAFTLLGSVYFSACHSGYSSNTATLEQGKQLFSLQCSACHGLEAEGFGPPLGGVTTLFDEASLLRFIQNPEAAIAAGDERATLLQARYKQVMPAFGHLAEGEIRSILAYLHQQTQLHQIAPLSLDSAATPAALKGSLAAPVAPSGLTIEWEPVIQLSRREGSSPNLGIATLRPHPSGEGTLFVSDQNGFIYRIHNGKAQVFLDAAAQIPDFQHGPGIATGIASFDFHPDFLENGLFYMLHAETYKGQAADYQIYADTLKSAVQWVLAEWKMDRVNDTVFSGTHRELLRLHAPTFGHGAQDMAFVPGLPKSDPDYGLLYFGFGDGGSNNIGRPELAHRLTSFLGTIMRIDPAGNNSKNGRYGIPADNPFVKEADPATVREIYAYGFRNPHRLAWDPAHGNRMIATDIAEANIEEINLIDKGGDYGWPNREGIYGITTTRDLKTVYPLAQSDKDLYRLPFAQYDHETGKAISGGYVYEGELAALKDKYIFGDIVSGRLFFVQVDPLMSDSTIYELGIVQGGKETSFQELSQAKRMHLRVAYDRFARQLYIMTKVDGRIWRASGVGGTPIAPKGV